MPKSLVPTHPHLRTKAQRIKRAKQWCLNLDAFQIDRVEVCIGSRRKNTRGIKPAKVEQVIHTTHTGLVIVKLQDGRFVFLDGRRLHSRETMDATVSHDLENLWWYGVDQPAREAFTAQIAKASA